MLAWAKSLSRSRYSALPRHSRFKGSTLSYFSVHQRYKWMLSQSPSPDDTNHEDQVVLSDQRKTSDILETMIEIKHYLRTRELPEETRVELLRLKLEELVKLPIAKESSKEYFETVNAAFMYFFSKTKRIDSVLSIHIIYKLFEKTAHFHIGSKRTDLPHYMGVLASKLIRSESELPTDVLLSMVLVGSKARLSGLSISLSYILRGKALTSNPDFTSSLLEHLAESNELNMDTFEALLTYKRSTPQNILINDDFVEALISHIQHIFADTNPKVHEYLDTNRSILKAQFLVNLMIEQYLEVSRPSLILKVLKLKTDLNSVSASTSDRDAVEHIILHLRVHEYNTNYSQVKKALLAENIDDEDVAEALLTQVSTACDSNKTFLPELCDFIIANKVRYTSGLLLKAELLKLVPTNMNKSCQAIFENIKGVYKRFLSSSEASSTLLTDTLQAVSTFKIDNVQELLDLASKDICEQVPGLELSIFDYKVMIDRAINSNEHELAFSLFEESLRMSNVHWAESLDPAIASTLDKLVMSSMQSSENIVESFPRFKKIKQHMPSSCSADTLSMLSKKMLAEACVGDVIELLTRELPKIKKDSYQKLRLDLPFSGPYKQLFNQLHEFVVTYRDDSSFETCWVFYGELHKYFHIPFESYLPVIKVFCEANRLNAALLIVRRMKMLSELHAESNINQPPSREIYIYLLKVFGDQLYEEGVIEVHEYLKMDTSIQTQDIHMQNCILGAYSNLQNVGKARDLFLAISSNATQHGGINEETAQIMIKTYTYSGLPYVKQFWNSLSQYGIFPDYAIYRQYLIAHTYHGHVEEAVQLINNIDDYNLDLSADLITSMYNYCIEPDMQKKIENWASVHHKEMWEDIQQSGLLKSASSFMPDNNLIASESGG